MSSILDMMEEDASPSKLEAFDGGGLKSAAKIATAIRETEDEIARTEAYLKEKKKDFPCDLPTFNGRVSPNKTKFMMLKNVPRINPFPTAF